MATEVVVQEERPHGGLRRELRFWEAIAISVGIMAPTAAMALNGVAPAGLVGRAVPLAFPALTRRIGEGLSRAEGIVGADPPTTTSAAARSRDRADA